ncbi:MAG: hypothetical protein WBE41_17225 [Terracidiphilus sp.]
MGYASLTAPGGIQDSLSSLGLVDRQISQHINFHDQYLLQKYTVNPEFMPICVPANVGWAGKGWTHLEAKLFILLGLLYLVALG